jgi:Tfp pilus assembly protein FimV
MTGKRLFAVLVSASMLLFSSGPGAQPASTYTVVKGDDVPAIVKKIKHPNVTESQMYYAFVQANINNFSMNTVERVTPGMQMRVPAQAEVAKVDVKKADEYMANLRKAETIFAEGVAAENKGDMKTAVEKYLASAKIGHAYAAQKLGQLYDKGVTKTLPHDLQESIKYYQEARKRGKEIKGPTDRAPQPTK